MSEILAPGVALFDMDNDGDLDVFLLQYRGQSRLFRNDLVDRKLSFTDATEKSGIAQLEAFSRTLRRYASA